MFRVVDNEFNRANYPHMIGKKYEIAPSYAVVEEIPKTGGTGTQSRMAAHNEVRRAGGTPREAIRAYCAGNKWLTENAKAVGNW